jgi:vacuolar-type H+-ATPase subunit I/STV1
VSSLDVDAYRHNWVWAFAEPDDTFPELTVPRSNQVTVNQDIENIQTAVVGLANLLNSHVQDKNNPHEVDAEDVQLEQVENFAASTDYKDTSEQLYATAKSVSDLDNATSAEIAEASEDLLEAITVTLDPGRTF